MRPRRPLAALLLCTACGASPTPAPADATATRDAHVEDAALDADAPPSDARDVTAADARSRCVNGAGLPYPDVVREVSQSDPLPDLRFETVRDDRDVTIALHDWYTPCAATPRLLMIRTLAAWSGPSRVAAAHTRRILEHPMASRVALLDLLVLNEDDVPANPRDLPSWRAVYDAPPTTLAADAAYALRPLYLSAGELPLVTFVDPRTMRIVDVVTRPSPEELAFRISAAVAKLDGAPRPPFPTAGLVDGHFTRDEWEMIRAMAPPAVPTPDPTNRVADDPRAARLGEALFNDAGLSGAGDVSCATCHVAARAFTDGRPVGVGAATGDRNTPTALAASYARWLFWDGRVDTAWAQALGPIENPLEMAGSRAAVARRVADRYASEYTALFGALPAPDDAGGAARVFVNAGKSIAAYERTLRLPTTAMDRYARGDLGALDAEQKNALREYFVAGCAQCHYGPMLTDDSFHNVGMPTGRRDGAPDRGRVDAVRTLADRTFRSDGPFSDAPALGPHLARLREDPSQLGQFHTPTLRGVAGTGPWGHGGTFRTLDDVVQHYAHGLTQAPVEGTVGERDVHLPAFHMSDASVARMVSLLRAMSE